MSVLLPAAVIEWAGTRIGPALAIGLDSGQGPSLALGFAHKLVACCAQFATLGTRTWPQPGPLYNPIIIPEPLTPTAIFAGPFGLLAFLPLVPIVLLIARAGGAPAPSRVAPFRSRRGMDSAPRLAILLPSTAWLLLTLRLPTTLVLLGGLTAGVCWLEWLAALRRRALLSQRGMKTLVWIGLHVLVLPLWWNARQAWYSTVSPLAALHNVGFAYYLLRFIAWGVRLAEDPHQPRRWLDTACWLLYPPCMRLGPVLLREDFLARFDEWKKSPRPQFHAGLRRLGLFVVGGVALGFVGRHIPVIRADGDFFSAPHLYATEYLVRAFYLVPIQVYLLLWTYNELAVATSLWIGIRVDDNFRWLPAATSVRDFWRRWHITVGAWLRDFIYIPLGGSRRNAWLNPFVVFGYCGIWHGAAFSFLAWGLSQAVAITVERMWAAFRGTHRAAYTLAPGGEAGGGADTRPTGLRRRAALERCAFWFLTLHYQLATVLMFVDFEHFGSRILAELVRRALG